MNMSSIVYKLTETLAMVYPRLSYVGDDIHVTVGNVDYPSNGIPETPMLAMVYT